jgi:TRAP-type C4-dicarboxylate transport system substrate-binding protein
LQTGTINGLVVPGQTFLASKLYSVAKYYTITNLYLGAAAVFMNLQAFNSLPSDLQKVVVSSAQDAAKMDFNQVETGADQAITQLEAQGVTVNTLPDSVIAAWRKATVPLYNGVSHSYGSKFLRSFTNP